MTKKRAILMVLASERFRDIEYIVPKAFFEQEGYKVVTASSKAVSTGRFGFRVENNLLIDNAKEDGYDGIYFVGGAGSLEYIENGNAKKLAESFYSAGKPVGAICAAPRNLLHWGMLKNRHATGHNWDGKFAELAVSFGAKPALDHTVVIDNGIMTANGPEAAEESALKFMEMLD